MAEQKSPFAKGHPSVESAQDGLPEGWPVNEDGRPWFRVSIGASEKIGLENIGLKFSSIEVGPLFVTTYVRPGDESIFKSDEEKIALTRVLEEVQILLELDVAAPQREKALDAIKNSQALADAIST